MHSNDKLISGGKDNKIIIHTAIAGSGEYTLEKSISLEASFPRALDYLNGNILVGLRNGSIYEINEETEEQNLLMIGHHEGETWGLDVAETFEGSSIFTIGDDNKIMEFNIETKKL